ncbi:uncharacterized protein LOC136082122 [Hydra vulgaris]|uniref:Uncharacterized protein LOC136082122 n=1 Tax=Hydra vulgaris TaxID=6087 RepID=A0ABM4C5B0_HYDVU
MNSNECIFKKKCGLCMGCACAQLVNASNIKITLKKESEKENIGRESVKRKRTANEKTEVKRKNYIYKKQKRKIGLGNLSEDVLIIIFKHVSAFGLINTSKTCWFFHRVCYTELLWQHRCKIDFNLETKWVNSTYLYLYEMFFKANVMRNFTANFQLILPYKRMKSIIVWYLINPDAPFIDVLWCTEKEAILTWKVTEKDLIEIYSEKKVTINETICYSWNSMYELSLKKHGGVVEFQKHVLKRCYRNRKVVEKQYKLFVDEYGGFSKREFIANKLQEFYS